MADSSDTQTVKVEVSSPEAAELRRLKALALVRNYSLGALAVGLIPLPLLDLVFAVVVVGRMLQKLAPAYGYPFEGEHRKYSLWGAIIGGLLVPMLLVPAALSLLKFIPVIGTVPGMIAMPIVLYASTYSVGRVFIQHFESGGTLLTFDPARVKQHLRSYYDEGLKAVGVNREKKESAESGAKSSSKPSSASPQSPPRELAAEDLPLAGPRSTM
ncbi:MAG: YcjF family protein [Myxococcota bacterium]